MMQFGAEATQPTTQLTTAEQNALIEQIHESFFTEVDKLLESAKISHSLHSEKQGLIDKHKRLYNLGFRNTKEMKEAESEIKRLEKLEKENAVKQEMVDCINYFTLKYPNYKFITEYSVKGICEKYGLVYGSIEKYIGTVPDKNLAVMEEFKVEEVDKITRICYTNQHTNGWDFLQNVSSLQSESIVENMNGRKDHSAYKAFPCSLEIAAPQYDFDMSNQEIRDFQLQDKPVPPDPIVLQPVIYNGKKHYLIVTAWGLESGDEEVVNERMN